jgi:hypothetical protein
MIMIERRWWFVMVCLSIAAFAAMSLAINVVLHEKLLPLVSDYLWPIVTITFACFTAILWWRKK